MPERKPMLIGIPIDGPSQPVPEPEQEEEDASKRHFYRPEPRNVYTPTPEQIEEASRKPNRKWLWSLVGLLAVASIAWLLMWSNGKQEEEQHAEEVVMADTVVTDDGAAADKQLASTGKSAVKEEPKKEEPKKEAKAEPVQEPKPAAPQPTTSSKIQPGEVTAVITSQEVLTTLAQKHYGSQWFWVYIYEENKNRGIVSNPNNITPGTRIVIPPAEKYGINAKDKASLRKAQLKSMEYFK